MVTVSRPTRSFRPFLMSTMMVSTPEKLWIFPPFHSAVAVYCVKAAFPRLWGLVRFAGPWMPLTSSLRM